MIKDRKEKQKVWQKLAKQLNGSCGSVCPKHINPDWSHMNCLEEFGFISGMGRLTTYSGELIWLKLTYSIRQLEISPVCPCLNKKVNQNEIMLHLEEITRRTHE